MKTSKTHSKQVSIIIVFFFCTVLSYAQVGINTTDPKGSLDVVGKPADATELDGVIAPRLTGNQLRAKPYTAAQTAAIVYVTAADSAPAGQTIDVTEIGYYFFDGSLWVRLAPEEDGDFHKVGFSEAPTLITENVFRSGNVGIGKTSANYPLDVYSATNERVAQFTRAGSDDGNNYGLFVTNSNTGQGVHYGMRVNISTTSTTGTHRHYGTYNQVNGETAGTNQNVGTYNTTNKGAGTHTGTFNSLTGTENSTNIGNSNYITNQGNGAHTGTRNLLKITNPSLNTGTGTKIGTYNGINSSLGDNYGVFNEIESTVAGKTSYGTYNDINGSAGLNIGGYFDSYGTGGTYYAAIFNRGHVVINEAAGDNDFRVESTSQQNMFFVDASSNEVGIGTNNPLATLDVRGSAIFNNNNGNKNFTVKSQNKNYTLHVDADKDFVGINKQYPNYTLDVDGDIRFSDDIFQGGTNLHPDHVFEKYFDGFSKFNPEYEVKSLDEIEKFIKVNKHLPGVQSRADVLENDWDMSEGVRVNLEKVEELFLHTIEASKKIKTLEKENSTLETKLDKALKAIELLNNRLEKLEKK